MSDEIHVAVHGRTLYTLHCRECSIFYAQIFYVSYPSKYYVHGFFLMKYSVRIYVRTLVFRN